MTAPDLDLDALGLVLQEWPWELPCPPPRRLPWQVIDTASGYAVAFGHDRDEAQANAARRLADHAERRGLTLSQLLDRLREVRHAR